MKKYILLFTAMVALLSSCKENELITVDAKNATLNFVKSYYIPSVIDPSYDTITFSSAYYGDATTAQVKLPVRMSGVIVDYDRPYSVRLVSEECSKILIEGVHFTLPKQQILHKGVYADSVVIDVNLTKLRADDMKALLVVELVAGENFGIGLERYQSMGVRLYGNSFFQEPLFWGRNSLDSYGGKYSSIKAVRYAMLNGITSDEWKESNQAKLFAYGKRTYEWFLNNPTYDNGKLVEFKGTINY